MYVCVCICVQMGEKERQRREKGDKKEKVIKSKMRVARGQEDRNRKWEKARDKKGKVRENG